MASSKTTETTTTWTCDFCGFQDMHIATGKDSAPVLPDGWIMVFTSRTVRQEEQFRNHYNKAHGVYYTVTSEDQFGEYMACSNCAKNLKSLVTRRSKEEPKPAPPPPPPPPPPPNPLARLIMSLRNPGKGPK